MYRVNLVYDDEEMLEFYEWEDDDYIIEIDDLSMYRVSYDMLKDFMYGKLFIEGMDDCMFIVGDGIYHFLVEIKDECLYRRGTFDYKSKKYLNQLIRQLPLSSFNYRILEEAYIKEFGLTRKEREKKQCLEEMIDEVFVVHYELFLSLCERLHIYEKNPQELYKKLKNKIDKGYTSLHEVLYKELIKKR